MAELVDLDQGFRLGDWEVKPRQFTLQRGEETHRLEPKVMAVLVCLAEHAGEPVTRDEFAEQVWTGRIVSDEVLSRDIFMLRDKLGCDARTPRFIQTLPRVGYRLIAPVVPLETEHAETNTRRRLGVGAAGIVILLIVVAWLGSQMQAPDPPELDETTIAVLPFDEPARDDAGPDDTYFGDGLADEIFGALARQEGIRVVARTSSFAFRDTQDDVRFIGTRLGAGSVLEGSVRRNDESLKVTARLVSANSGLQLWSQSYERTLADIFAVQHEIAQAIAKKLAGSLVSAAPPPPTVDLEAYHLFLRGHHALRRRGPEPVRRAVTLFEAAVERDPGFGRAYVGLAEALILVPTYTEEADAPYLERAVAALDDARANGTVDSRAHGVLGVFHYRRWNWRQAESEFRQALSEAPEDPELRQWYSQFLANTGHLNTALAEAERAVKLDPLSPTANQRFAVMSMLTGNLERAQQLFAMATELGIEPLANPRAQVGLALMQGQAGNATDQLGAIQRSRLRDDNWIEPVIAAISGQGDADVAAQRLARAFADGEITPVLLIGALFLMDDPDLFYEQTLPIVAARTPFDIEILFTARAQTLRDDHRFVDLLGDVGLIDYWRRAGWPEVCEEAEREGWCHN
jgi:TolB-like protein/Flp pilus assembly protein TadD